MKDAFFEWKGRIDNFIYRCVLRITYCVITRRRCCKFPKLTADERRTIQSYWKKVYGKKIPTYEYRWYKTKCGNVDPRLIPDTIWHSVIEPYYAINQMVCGSYGRK